jgi:Ca2+-binding RTX toxin-like protein
MADDSILHDLNDDNGVDPAGVHEANDLNGIHDANDDHPHGVFDVSDMTAGGNGSLSGNLYSGPVSGIDDEIILATPKNINVSATSLNTFIHTGSGDDAIRVLGGTNVLDGGTGSNFLTGGSGHDTYFVDDRGSDSDIWSTVVNFHSGDDVTVWGVTSQDFKFDWVDNQGAGGFTGLTMHATEAGHPTASLTMAGYTSDDLHNGRLSVSFGHTDDQPGAPGASYMVIHGS